MSTKTTHSHRGVSRGSTEERGDEGGAWTLARCLHLGRTGGNKRHLREALRACTAWALRPTPPPDVWLALALLQSRLGQDLNALETCTRGCETLRDLGLHDQARVLLDIAPPSIQAVTTPATEKAIESLCRIGKHAMAVERPQIGAAAMRAAARCLGTTGERALPLLQEAMHAQPSDDPTVIETLVETALSLPLTEAVREIAASATRLAQDGHLDEAIVLAEHALERTSDDSLAPLCAELRVRRGRRGDAVCAVLVLRDRLRDNPNDRVALALSVRAMKILGHDENATDIQEYLRGDRIRIDALEALHAWRERLEQNPSDVRMMLNVGDWAARAGLYDEAATAYLGTADTYLENEPAKALAVLQQTLRMLERTCPNDWPKRNPTLERLVKLQVRMGRVEEALATCDEIVRAFRRLGDHDRVVEMQRRRVEITGGNPFARLSLAEDLLRANLTSEAEVHLRAAAQALATMGRYESAAVALERLMQHGPDAHLAREAAALRLRDGSHNNAMAAMSLLRPYVSTIRTERATLELLAQACDILGERRRAIQIREEMEHSP